MAQPIERRIARDVVRGATGRMHDHSVDPTGTHRPAGATMPIGICTAGELFGGVERHVLGIASNLRARGERILLFLFHDAELAAQARAIGIDPVILPGRNWSLVPTARRLAQILEDSHVRIVHVHGYKATVFCAMARNWHSFAMCKTEHGLPEPMGRMSPRGWRNRLYYVAETLATRQAGATVCYVSEDLREAYLHAHHGLRVTVIPNGVRHMDPGEFPRPSALREDSFNLLIAGRVDLVKGHHVAIKAIAAQGIAGDVQLHILGEGPCVRELQAHADACGVGDRVHMLGFRRNAYDYIAHCDVLLMPSLHEGLPYTLLEAMALGKPIIAARVGGLAETLENEVTALLFPARDHVALANAIMRLHDDRALCSKLGHAARSLQQTRYSIDAMTESYLAEYRARTVTA